MNKLKDWLAAVVAKLVFAAQWIPIGEMTFTKRLSALFMSQDQREALNQTWQRFIKQNKHNQKYHPQRAVEYKRHLFKTPTHAQLDTVEFISKTHRKPKNHVIYVWGRVDCYEKHLHQLAEDALNLKAKIISFNFRNVACSQGKLRSKEDLINDLIFQVMRLIKQGVSSQNITLYGHSMGGAIATLAAARLSKSNLPVKLYCDRSFGRFTDTLLARFFAHSENRFKIVTSITLILFLFAALIGVGTGLISGSSAILLFTMSALSCFYSRTASLYDKLLVEPLKHFLRWLIKTTDWQMNIAQSYESLKPWQKRHTVIQKTKRSHSALLGAKIFKAPFKDEVIAYEQSLHKNLTHFHLMKRELRIKLNHATQTQSSRKDELIKKLSEMSQAKMTGALHGDSPKSLICSYPSYTNKHMISGQQYFYQFVEPMRKRHKKASLNYLNFD